MTHLPQQDRVLPTWPSAWNVLGHSQDSGRDHRASGPLQLQDGGPHLAAQVPPSSQGTQATGFIKTWGIQRPQTEVSQGGELEAEEGTPVGPCKCS